MYIFVENHYNNGIICVEVILMEEKRFAVSDFTTAKEIKRIRKLLQLTQKEFARLVGCSKPTIERWETSSSPITGPVVLLLQLIEREPNCISALEIPPRQLPLRLWYMHDQQLCTLIDVDEINRKIKYIAVRCSRISYDFSDCEILRDELVVGKCHRDFFAAVGCLKRC